MNVSERIMNPFVNAGKAVLNGGVNATKAVVSGGVYATKAVVNGGVSATKAVAITSFNASKAVVNGGVSATKAVATTGFNATKAVVNGGIYTTKAVANAGISTLKVGTYISLKTVGETSNFIGSSVGAVGVIGSTILMVDGFQYRDHGVLTSILNLSADALQGRSILTATLPIVAKVAIVLNPEKLKDVIAVDAHYGLGKFEMAVAAGALLASPVIYLAGKSIKNLTNDFAKKLYN